MKKSTPKAGESKVNSKWFTDRLKDSDLSLRKLAQRLDLEPSALSLTFNGKRKLQAAEAVEIARHLGVPVADVFANAGVKIAAQNGAAPRQVRLAGWVELNGAADLDWSGRDESVDGPPGLAAGSVAVQVRSAAFRDGDILFLSPPEKSVPADAIGRQCLVRLKTGAHAIRFVRKGYKAGLYNLLHDAGLAETDVAVEWAAPLYWIKAA